MNNPYQAPGSSVEPTMTNCSGCSKEIHVHASMCPNCGLPQRSRSYKSKTITGLFAMIFGALGVHRFYLGQWWGIFYLFLCWTGIPSIISFFEAFVFWFSDLVKWDRKYNESKPAGPSEKSGAGTIVLVVVAVGFFGIMIIGILASISIPAYQDYTIRAKVSEALVETAPAKTSLIDYYQANEALPGSNSELGHVRDLPSGGAIDVYDSGLILTFGDATSQLENKEILLTPFNSDNGVQWDCTGGTLEAKFRPSMCRPSRDAE